MSYVSQAPNMLAVVEAVHADRPGLIHRPHDFTAGSVRVVRSWAR